MQQAIDINASERTDKVYALINIKTGWIEEVPCGPLAAGYLSGDRPLVWNPIGKRPEIPKRWETTYRFYSDFCRDPDVARQAGMNPQQSARYAETYDEFMKARGHGASARVPQGFDARKLLHPLAQKIRKKHDGAGGQATLSADVFERLTNNLAGAPAVNFVIAQERAAAGDKGGALEAAERAVEGFEALSLDKKAAEVRAWVEGVLGRARAQSSAAVGDKQGAEQSSEEQG